MKYRLIACNVFQPELEYLLPRTPQVVDCEYLELGEHARPHDLRRKLQERLDAPAGDADAVLLAYGLCGGAADGLTARQLPVVLPRSHDCCGILLGSRRRFEEIFRPMPSMPYSSAGFIAHGDYYFSEGEMMHGDGYAALVEQYGEDDARYIWEAMHPRLDGELLPVHFISTPEIPAAEACRQCRERAALEGRPYRELTGSLRLLAGLLAGDWAADEFLVLPPGRTIRQTGDWNEILRVAAGD